jgi:predicted dehydrogenase
VFRFGLIGYGAWGCHHAEAIAKAPRARLAAIACRTEATAETARRDFSGVPIHLGRLLSIGHELRLSAQWGRINAMIDEEEIGERSDSPGARRGSTDHGRARMKRARQREDSAGRIWSAIRSMVSRMAG